MTTRGARVPTPRPARPDVRDERGAALITVLGLMAVMSIMAIAALGFATNNIGYARDSQDRSGAVAAAQAGVEDFLARLNQCDGYWDTPCSGDPGNPALEGGWVDVPNADLETPARFRYEVLTTPADRPGVLELESTGRVDGQERTVVATLRKVGFLKFIYYTDFESVDPLITQRTVRPRSYAGSGDYTDIVYHGFESADDFRRVTDACRRYHYGNADSGRPSFAERVTYKYRGSPRSTSVSHDCELQFFTGDKIDGPLHSNDALLVADGAWFADPTVQTSWPATATPAPDPTDWFRKSWAGSQPSRGTPAEPGYRPRYADPMPMPPSNIEIRAAADPAQGGQGCLYRGATRITFRDDGRLDVHSPLSRNNELNRGCGKNLNNKTTVDGPTNGVVYVDTGTGTCSGKVLGAFPESGDVSGIQYLCTSGDAFVEGTVDGRFTVATADDVIVVDDVVYEGGLAGDDVLGLVANNNVETYHPVKTCSSGTRCQFGEQSFGAQFDKLRDGGVTQVDAAILSVNHSFTVQAYDRGVEEGTLLVRGGIYQRHRGPVGSTYTRPDGSTVTSGYIKDYRYDPRLLSLPPPYFLNPEDAAWEVVAFTEERAG